MKLAISFFMSIILLAMPQAGAQSINCEVKDKALRLGQATAQQPASISILAAFVPTENDDANLKEGLQAKFETALRDINNQFKSQYIHITLISKGVLNFDSPMTHKPDSLQDVVLRMSIDENVTFYRDTKDVDIVVFLTNFQGDGYGGGMVCGASGADLAIPETAFIAINLNSYCDHFALTLAHELGHVMGAGGVDATDAYGNAVRDGGDCFPYARAYQLKRAARQIFGYRTVMAPACPGRACDPHTMNWSSPDSCYAVSRYSCLPLGDAGHNNVLVLNQTARWIAGLHKKKLSNIQKTIDELQKLMKWADD